MNWQEYFLDVLPECENRRLTMAGFDIDRLEQLRQHGFRLAL